jgi:hypothetical protein
MEEGPVMGFTEILFWWASKTNAAPGSAIPGQPASERTPTELPFFHLYIKVFD